MQAVELPETILQAWGPEAAQDFMDWLENRLRVSAKLNVTQVAARRKVNVFVLNEIGTGLGGDTPTLVVHDNRLCWRVPVILALPLRGRLGQVGQIDVDAQTGEILASDQEIRDIADHATRLVAGPPL